jgi:hypothetical protein
MPMTAVQSDSADRHRPDATAARWRALLWLSIGLMSLGCLVGVLVPAGAGWDFANFYDTGHRVAAGQIADVYDPVSAIDGAAPQGGMRFWGTPISAVFYAPLSWFSPGTALILFKVQNVAAFVASFVLLYVLSRRFADGPHPAREQFAAVFAFLCLVYQPFWTVFRVGGQTTPTVFLLFTIALFCHVYSHHWTAAACLVLASLIKPALAPALLCLVILAGWSFLVKIGVLAAAAGLASVALLGWPIHLTFLDAVRSGVPAPFPWQYSSSLYIFIDSLHTALGTRAGTQPYPALLTAVNYALKAITLATIVALVIKGRSRNLSPAAWRHFSVLVVHHLGALPRAALHSAHLCGRVLALVQPERAVARRRRVCRLARSEPHLCQLAEPAGRRGTGPGPAGGDDLQGGAADPDARLRLAARAGARRELRGPCLAAACDS